LTFNYEIIIICILYMIQNTKDNIHDYIYMIKYNSLINFIFSLFWGEF
jgi:hypothetical protein